MSLPDVSMFNTARLPDLPRERLSISFSGGRTSALMTALLLHEYTHTRGVQTCVIFANTGQEHPDTLRFVDACDKQWGFSSVWVEAAVDPTPRVGTRERVVTFATASRDGKPYEDACAKYGVPNVNSLWCTRELKQRPIHSYLNRTLGWKKNTVTTAIGIRADEMDRMSARAKEDGFVYPLVTLGISKKDVLAWFKQQAFDLPIPEHLGNCTWCWKKSFRKLFTLARDNKEVFDFPAKLEALYGNAGALARVTGKSQVFFRGGRSTQDLLKEAAEFTGPFFTDSNWAYDREVDLGAACGETCEIGTDEPDGPYRDVLKELMAEDDDFDL